MERPDALPGLKRARQYLAEVPELVNAYGEGVRGQLGAASGGGFRLAAFDAQVLAVNAPASSLEADIFALEARVGDRS